MDENKIPEKVKLENYIKYYQIQKDLEEKAKELETPDGFFDKFTPYFVALLSFYALSILVFFSMVVMTLQFIDSDYTYQILKRSFISAVSPDQDINLVMYTDIIQVVDFDEKNITTGDNVVIFGDYNIDEYWVEQVTNVDIENRELDVTYDQVSFNTVSFDDVIGTYEKEANIFGTILYTAKFTRGYILIIASHLIVVLFYYLSIVNPRKELPGLEDIQDEKV